MSWQNENVKMFIRVNVIPDPTTLPPKTEKEWFNPRGRRILTVRGGKVIRKN